MQKAGSHSSQISYAQSYYIKVNLPTVLTIKFKQQCPLILAIIFLLKPIVMIILFKL